MQSYLIGCFIGAREVVIAPKLDSTKPNNASKFLTAHNIYMLTCKQTNQLATRRYLTLNNATASSKPVCLQDCNLSGQ